MQAKRLSAVQGVQWIAEGFRLYRSNPPLLSSLTLGYLMVVIVLQLVPLLGPLAVAVALPAMTVVLGNGCRIIDGKQRVALPALRAGIDRNMPALLRLGLVQLGGSIAIILLGMVLFGEPPDPEQAKPQDVLRGLLLLLPLLLPLMLLLWYAPYLVAWHGVTVAKSLFFSIAAVIRNTGAFVVFFISAAVLGIGVPFGLMSALSAGGSPPAILRVVMELIVLLVLAPTLAAAVYVSYRDVFDADVGTGAPH